MQLSVKPGIPLSLFSNLLPHLCYLSVLSAAIENSTGKDSSKELSSHQLAFQNFILLPLPQNVSYFLYHLSLQLPLYTSSPRSSGLPGLYYVASSVVSEDSLLHVSHLDQNMLLLSIFGLIYLITFFSLNSNWSVWRHAYLSIRSTILPRIMWCFVSLRYEMQLLLKVKDIPGVMYKEPFYFVLFFYFNDSKRVMFHLAW